MTKETSEANWPGAYYSSGYIACRGNSMDEIQAQAIAPYAGGLSVEIGAGGGCWTSALANKCQRLIAVDVIPRKPRFDTSVNGANNVDYMLVQDGGLLPGIANESVTFFWSYDVFCHLPFSTSRVYLMEFARCLIKGGHASSMFSCYERHPGRQAFPRLARNVMDSSQWFDYPEEDIYEMARDANLAVEKLDLFPKNRDRLTLFTKV